ncbi:MAG: Type I restriction-modification system, specificity subunit S [Microgenomates bacterium 39_6]|nr:MAG: Type I restriction-modification system, specificity subunit S [Microgenomates bacterium 39_6]
MTKQQTNYKQTEISEIPRNWKETTLGGIATFHYGKGLPQKTRVDGSIPVFGSSGVTGYHNQSLVKEPGYIIGREGSIGTVYYSQKPFFPIDTVYYATESDINCDFNYFYYLLRHLKLNELNSDSAVPGLNIETAYSQKVYLPKSIAEQQEIASILSSLDDKIELNRRMNKTLEEIGKALFRQWFVDFEFPDENGIPYKSSGGEMIDSELGEIPKGWEVRSLDMVAYYLNGLACQKYPPENEKDALPVIKIAELRKGFSESSDSASRKVDDKYHIKNGDVLFSWSGSLEVCLWPYGEGILNQHLFKVTSEEYPKWFYYFWILYHLDEFRIIASGKATTMGHIQRKHLTNAKVLVPNGASLENMSLIMTPVVSKLVKNSYEISKLQNIRDSLLPRLMSGKLRVKN